MASQKKAPGRGRASPVLCRGESLLFEVFSKFYLQGTSQGASGKLHLHVNAQCLCLGMKFIYTKFQGGAKTVPITF